MASTNAPTFSSYYRWINSFLLKLLIASRDENLIHDAFTSLPRLRTAFYSHEADKDMVKDDIQKYLKMSLDKIKGVQVLAPFSMFSVLKMRFTSRSVRPRSKSSASPIWSWPTAFLCTLKHAPEVTHFGLKFFIKDRELLWITALARRFYIDAMKV